MDFKYIFNANLGEWAPIAKYLAVKEKTAIAKTATESGYTFFALRGDIYFCGMSGGAWFAVRTGARERAPHPVPEKNIFNGYDFTSLYAACLAAVDAGKPFCRYSGCLYFCSRPVPGLLLATMSTEMYYFENVVIRPVMY